MDFQFTEEQLAIREAATGIIDGMVDPDRVAAVEASEDRFDAELWAALAAGDLLGFGTPESDGGNGGGMVEIGQILEVQGRAVAPVPLHATLVEGVLPIARFGSDALCSRLLPGVAAGQVILTGALADAAASPSQLPRVRASKVDGSWRLEGLASAVPFAHVAHAAVVPARTDDGDVVVAVVPLDDASVSLERVVTTNRAIHPNVTFAGTLIQEDAVLGGTDVLEAMLAWAQTGLALLQVGICSAALERGSPDIFMNILTTNGLVGRYITDWSGPGGFLRKVDIRLGAPNYPDDTMTLTGQVTEVADDVHDPDRGQVTIGIVGANSIGNHVVGTVTLTLPKNEVIG